MHLDVDGLLELQQNGWEIGSHGVTHRSLLRLNDDEIVFELEESKRRLEIILDRLNHMHIHMEIIASIYSEK